jgi:hypothetical protein
MLLRRDALLTAILQMLICIRFPQAMLQSSHKSANLFLLFKMTEMSVPGNIPSG